MKKNTQIKIIIILFILLMIGLTYIKIKNDTNTELLESEQISSIFEKISDSTTGKITKYFVYGTHFNIEGEITIPKISEISISKVDIIIKSTQYEESLKTTYSYKDSVLTFSTTENINEGLDLETLKENNYYIFLKAVFSNGEIKQYSLTNNTQYSNINYYTITQNNSNNKIDISFSTYNDIQYMGITVSKATNLPNNVYDIAIDPGHGGLDSGATFQGKKEAELVLEYSLNLKQKLEKLGYKVFITRDNSSPKDENTALNMYEDNGRVTKAMESHAKILLSIHINDNPTNYSKKGGVEIYAPSNCNLDFAKQLATSIVKTAQTDYSGYQTFKQSNGVYVRNFTQYDIQAYSTKAKNSGYEPYNLTTSTPYLYIIRETGGIATNAFVDGRNKSYCANKYYNSNVGIESYSIELGYMKVKNDLNNIIKNNDLYMQAIANSLNNYIKN